MSWSTSELRVRLAPLNRFKPSSKIFYWPFQGGTSFVDLLCFCSVLCLLCFVRVCLYVLCGHLLGKGWPLGSRLWCLLWVCHFPIGILGQVWYLIVSIPDLCNLITFKIIYRSQKLSLFHVKLIELGGGGGGVCVGFAKASTPKLPPPPPKKKKIRHTPKHIWNLSIHQKIVPLCTLTLKWPPKYGSPI